MNNSEYIDLVKKYNKNLDVLKLCPLEKLFFDQVEKQSNLYLYKIKENISLPKNVETFLEENHYFKALLPNHYEKLCFYLRHIQEFTCNNDLIRMDTRSKNFSYYKGKVINAIGGFYMFYGANMEIKDLIYGQYRQILGYIDFAPVIATELLQDNLAVSDYCKEVLVSENNVAVLTREVIVAIEQSHNQELQELLINLFLAAKLQEGLRQAIIETVDEQQLDFFKSIIDVIQRENLLRYSSIQRGVMTWIGIGYEIVDEKQMRFIFNCIYDYLHDELKQKEAFDLDNPLCIYIALYTLGIYDVDLAIDKASDLLNSSKRHIVAAALIYLKLTHHFDVIKYDYFLSQYLDDPWIMALYISECTYLDFKKIAVSNEQIYHYFNAINQYTLKMKSQETFTSKGFEWFSVVLYKFSISKCLFKMIQRYPMVEMIEDFLPYISSNLNNEELKIFMEEYFIKLPDEVKKSFMLKEIISNNQLLCGYIAKEYSKMKLNEKDIEKLEGRLKTKKGYARALIINILAKQSKENILKSHARLQNSTVKTIQESAKELELKVPEYFKITAQPKVVIKGKEEGFGLYTPYTIYELPYESKLTYKEKGLFKKKKYLDMSFINVMTKKQVLDYIALWNKRILAHIDDEYEVRGEIHQIRENYFFPIDYSKNSLEALPLANVWREYFKEDELSINQIFFLQFVNQSSNVYLEKTFDEEIGAFDINNDDIKECKYYNHYRKIFDYYYREYSDCVEFKEIAYKLIEIFNHHSKYKQYWKQDYQGNKVIYALSSINIYSFLINCLDLNNVSDLEFKKYFPIVYDSYVEFNLKLKQETQSKFKIQPLILARAVSLGLLKQPALFEGILDTHISKLENNYIYSNDSDLMFEAYRDAYFKGRGIYGKPSLELPDNQQDVYNCLRNSLDIIADTLLTMEATRLNEETLVTPYVKRLRVIRGMKHLIGALHVLDHEEIKRQSYGNDRVDVFSSVIKNTYPLENENVELLKKENFSPKRIVETAMLAPQWIDYINDVLNWDGFKEACYYFVAHMKQYDSQQKKAEISKYTDLDPDDLNDGAFDMNWCKEIYDKLGEEKMQIIYNASKFLCENSFHTRARKYADALLGKQSKDDYLKQAIDKRNKDALNAYCIAPIKDDHDLLERYTYVQRFLKDSKKFGAQRQASEKRACEIALLNLARNSRFETVTRLSWMMESELVNQNIEYLKPQFVEDVEVWIEINEFGQNEICVQKNGKRLKNIPAKLKKNEKILEIKNIHQLWTNQYRRSKTMLETAMEERTIFTLEEIEVMFKNPIVGVMLSNLILMSHNHFGYYCNGKLQGIDDTVDFDNQIKIAHPFDLYQAGIWHTYQKDIFNKKIVQPFKQVFRELYLKLDDELETHLSKRYSGYQIQPKKAAGALKNRKWNATYENGLERVYYKENMIVNLYANADWFSPSDIEAPSIDYVSFTNRKTGEAVLIKDIDDVVFSETMRDVDLAVSVAYVGGVDPITSFSTMELRKTIIEYTASLMKLDNVEVKDHFVNIKGVHNDYSIHLGSGNIYQSGGPAIHVVAVYSLQRGKVYLPFLDEDPSTALIVSKVVMFANDQKIKDPSILQQIITN